jgi:hypothetical protein
MIFDSIAIPAGQTGQIAFYQKSTYQVALARGDLRVAARVEKVHGFHYSQAWCPP